MLLNVEQVQELSQVKKSKAYKMISTLNQELHQQGYLTLNGKVEESYLKKRYGLLEQQHGLSEQQHGLLKQQHGLLKQNEM